MYQKSPVLVNFSETENLLNEKRAITIAASADKKLRTVKEKTTDQPFIAAPISRNETF